MGAKKILLQTTIERTEDDWHIGRFSLLAEHLREAGYDVTTRDRAGKADPVLAGLDGSDFDQVWLFAVDTGDGLDDAERAAIERFHARGGGLMVTRDHMDLGCSVCSIRGVGAAHRFHSHNFDPATTYTADDTGTPEILWPNYHSGANGDAQAIAIEGAIHPILRDDASPTGALRYLPAHPHEGAVAAPADEARARVIATGTSQATRARFNLAVAFEPTADFGPALAQSTFHHFADYNWDPARGCPSFVSEQPGDSLATTPGALADVHRYVRNAAAWLARR